MADQFIERTAELSGQTSRVLQQMAEDLREAGLTTQATTLLTLAQMHDALLMDCLTETQPIDTVRYQLSKRIEKDTEELQELAADLLSRGHPGHSQVSEAAAMLEVALKLQGGADE